MKTNELTPQLRRKRKFMLFLPLIILPLVTLLFWTLGGARGDSPVNAHQNGLSMHLPGVLLDVDSAADKMTFYDHASTDSAKRAQLRKADPYADLKSDTVGLLNNAPLAGFEGSASTAVDPSVQANQINERLQQLQAVLNKPEPAKERQRQYYTIPPVTDSLLRMIPAEDPELKQMGGLLDKILDIQHPERVKTAQQNPTTVIPVRKFRAIPAVIEADQKIVQGTVICLKLLDSVTIGGQFFNKGQKLYGSGNLSNQRFRLDIQSIHVGANFYPVNLTVFDDQDGMEGICVPEAITDDALRAGAVNSLQGVGVMSLDPSITAQLTTAGINTVKDAFGKKVKRVKGRIRKGHRLLLRDNSEINKSGNILNQEP